MEEHLTARIAAFWFLAVLEVLFEVLHEDALHAALVAGHFNRKDNIDETFVERVDSAPTLPTLQFIGQRVG